MLLAFEELSSANRLVRVAVVVVVVVVWMVMMCVRCVISDVSFYHHMLFDRFYSHLVDSDNDISVHNYILICHSMMKMILTVIS